MRRPFCHAGDSNQSRAFGFCRYASLEGKGIDSRIGADVAVIAASASTLHTQDQCLDFFACARRS
jgi:hypothetical protein